MADQVECVFFDVGNVILCDYPSEALFYWHLHNAIAAHGSPQTPYRQLLIERDRLLAAGEPGPSAKLARNYLGEQGARAVWKSFRLELAQRYDEVTPFLPGIRDVIEGLQGRVKLGIIANQPEQCVHRLKRGGLWEFFCVHGISDVVGLSKPDPGFFRWACEQAGVPADRCLMVGDRLDNDVRPAGEIGMGAVWLDWRSVADMGIAPANEYERLYFDFIGGSSDARRPAEQVPTLHNRHVVHSIQELGDLLAGALRGQNGQESSAPGVEA